MCASSHADDVRKLTDDELLETLGELDNAHCRGLPLYDLPSADGPPFPGVLTTLGLTKDELQLFIVEASGDTTIPFLDRLAQWTSSLAPAAPPAGPSAADGAAAAAPLGAHGTRGRGRGCGGGRGGGRGGRGRGRGGKDAQGSLCAPSVRVDHSADWWKLTRNADGTWCHTAERSRNFKGVDKPIYNTTRSTPKKRSASGSLEVVHDETWALGTQLDDKWFKFLRDQCVVYLHYQRGEQTALKLSGKPYIKRFLETKKMGGQDVHIVNEPSLDELKKFIAVTLHRGMKGNPSIKHYYSEDAGNYCPLVKQLGLSRHRYQDLIMILHCQDDFSTAGKDKAKTRGPEECRKVQDLLDLFKQNCQEAFKAGRELSYDEMMIRWNGLLKEKFIKQPKPISVGLKMMALCDALTGYLLDFALDKKDGTRKDDVLFRVCANYEGKNHRLYADNAFVTVHSLKELVKKGIYCTGTTSRSTGKGLPAEMIKVKEFKTEGGETAFTLGCGDVLRVGEYACMEAKCDGPFGCAAAQETLFCFAWFDSGICNFMTTVDIPEDDTVLRRACLAGNSAEESTRVRPERASFSAASNYNRFMAGVDTNDNMRSRYFCQKHSRKWWHAVFYWMVDVATINAYIIWCLGNGIDRRKDSHHGGRYRFLMRLVKKLAGVKDSDAAPVSPAAPVSVSKSSKTRLVQTGTRISEEGELTVGDDILLRLPSCEMPVPVEFVLHPKYAHCKKGPVCKHCFIVDGHKNNGSNSPVVCLGCDQPLCRKHWMQFPPHAAFFKAHNIEVANVWGEI